MSIEWDGYRGLHSTSKEEYARKAKRALRKAEQTNDEELRESYFQKASRFFRRAKR